MKILFHILAIGALVHLLSLFFSIQISWIVLVIYGGLWNLKGAWPFLIGFIAVFIIWALYAYGLDWFNGSILSNRIGKLFHVPSWLVPLISGLIGGLLGGSSTWLGFNLRRLITR